MWKERWQVAESRQVQNYLNGRGERSQTDRSDLNVPLPLLCEVAGKELWTQRAG